MGKLKTIYLALLNNEEKIVEKNEILKLIENYNKKFKKVSVKNALWYLSRHNYIKRIFLGYYYINSIDERAREICNYEDRELLFVALNKSSIRWYLGLSSALYTLGEIWQIPNILTIINNKISGKRMILGMKVNFIKIKNELIFGLLSNKTENNIKYFYSGKQKTSLDFAYLTGKKITKDKKTKRYIKKYPKWLQKLT